MVLRRRRPAPRLPQDVAASGDPRPVPLDSDTHVDEWARRYERSRQADDLAGRATALWGLASHGYAALDWVRGQLATRDDVRVSDAAGVLTWIGVPETWRPRLRALAASLPDGEAADALHLALGPESAEDAGPTTSAGQLLGGALAPFTDTVWFVEADLDLAVDTVRRWLDGIDRRDALTPLTAPLPDLLAALEPFSVPSWKQLLVRAGNGWTALFSQGSDLPSADNIGRLLGRRHLRTNYSSHVVRDGRVVSHGDRAFWLTDPSSERGSRTVQASYQSRWTWHAFGTPQPFEHLEAYAARRIPDRLDLARLNSYCAALGIDRADPAFYGPDAVLVTEDTSRWDRRPTNTMPSHVWRAGNT